MNVGSTPAFRAKYKEKEMDKNRRITEEDKQRMYDYLEKTGANYTINTNPSEEEIARIRGVIERNECILKVGKIIAK